jgi:pimeloyl-ACP methyl ester carboxylesterase
MNQFFFGNTERPLYGVHHEPGARQSRQTAILVCYPFGREYMRCHRALVRFCDRLAAAGYHSLRFDYFGTGDSAGDNSEGGVSEWVANTRMATQELKDVSGLEKVSIVGVRLGAAIAMHAAAAEPALENLVLWDPVVDGALYLDGLESMHDEFVNDVNRFPKTGTGARHTGDDELVGMVWSSAMRQSIRGIDLAAMAKTNVRGVSIIASEDRDEFRRLRDSLGARGTECHYRVVNERIAWETLSELGVVLMPHALLQTMSETVVAACP